MGARHTKTYDASLVLIAQRLREDKVVQEPLPERWVDLIHYLNEQERCEGARQTEAEAPKGKEPSSR